MHAIMIIRYYFIACFFLLNLSSSVIAQNKKCDYNYYPIVTPEVLRYKIYYSLAGAFIGAGEVTFSTKKIHQQSKPVYYLSGRGYTYSAYDWIYRVRDVYECWVDSATARPIQSKRNIEEGGRRLQQQTTFNYLSMMAYAGSKKTPITGCIQDVLSAIYYARQINFDNYKPGQQHLFNMYLDDTVYPISITYLGKKFIKTRHGNYQTLMFKPSLIEGTIFKAGDNMTVYVTDDRYKIPVYIETPIIVGSIKVYWIP